MTPPPADRHPSRRRPDRRALGLVVCLLTLISCSSGRPASTNLPSVTAAPDEADLVGSWTDLRNGQTLPDGDRAVDGRLIVSTFATSTTCNDRNVTVAMLLPLPVGTEVNILDGSTLDVAVPRFLRSTVGSAFETYGTSDDDTTLPPGARATQFTREGNRIHLGAGSNQVYVERADGTIERWPRVKGTTGCG